MKIITNPIPAVLFLELMLIKESSDPTQAVEIRLTSMQDPSEALGLYDTIRLFPNIDTRVVLFAGMISVNALVVAAAANKKMCISHTLVGFKDASYARAMLSDLKIMKASYDAVKTRATEIISTSFGIMKERQDELYRDTGMVDSSDLLGRGFTLWEMQS